METMVINNKGRFDGLYYFGKISKYLLLPGDNISIIKIKVVNDTS